MKNTKKATIIGLIIVLVVLTGCENDNYKEVDFDGLVTREEYKLLKCESGYKNYIQSTDPNLIKAFCSIGGDIREDVSADCLDYNNLNYTTLNISREDFEKLECYRQRDWLSGWCFPEECKARNPPVCNFIYATYCYDEDDPSVKYANNIWIK